MVGTNYIRDIYNTIHRSLLEERQRVILRHFDGSQQVKELRVDSSDTQIVVGGFTYTWDGQSTNRAGWPIYTARSELIDGVHTISTSPFQIISLPPDELESITIDDIHRRLDGLAMTLGRYPIKGIIVSPEDFARLIENPSIRGYSYSTRGMTDLRIQHYLGEISITPVPNTEGIGVVI